MARVKLPGYNLAVGTWKNPHKRQRMDQTAQKIVVYLRDKLITMGRTAFLYEPVEATTAGVVSCTCTKDTTQSADRNCLTCHGTKFAPGYHKFLHSTIFFCSAEAQSFTPSTIEIFDAKKGQVYVVETGSTTGSVVTTDKAYSNPNNEDWEVKLDAFERADFQSITADFSVDAGTTWMSISLTKGSIPGTGYTGTIAGTDLAGDGDVRVRITLNRANPTDLSPAFEIIRIRRKLVENQNDLRLKRFRPDYVDGSILILRPWVQEQDSFEPGRGRLMDHLGSRTWTTPLDFFDTALTPNTPVTRIKDGDLGTGPHAFFEFNAGVQTTTRYALVKAYYNEGFGPTVFTHQYFDDRRIQPGEALYSVF